MKSNIVVEGVKLESYYSGQFISKENILYYECNYNKGNCRYSDYLRSSVFYRHIKDGLYGRIPKVMLEHDMKDVVLPRCRWRKINEK